MRSGTPGGIQKVGASSSLLAGLASPSSVRAVGVQIVSIYLWSERTAPAGIKLGMARRGVAGSPGEVFANRLSPLSAGPPIASTFSLSEQIVQAGINPGVEYVVYSSDHLYFISYYLQV